jgi:hypothetical protein
LTKRFHGPWFWQTMHAQVACPLLHFSFFLHLLLNYLCEPIFLIHLHFIYHVFISFCYSDTFVNPLSTYVSLVLYLCLTLSMKFSTLSHLLFSFEILALITNLLRSVIRANTYYA